VEVLERQGVEVGVPCRRNCCGQMHLNSGYRDDCIPQVAEVTSDPAALLHHSPRRDRAWKRRDAAVNLAEC
jgi:Fe-S oxidoreductase